MKLNSKIFNIILLFILVALSTNAQNIQLKKWYLNKTEIDFTTLPVISSFTGSISEHVVNGIYNSTPSRLLYTRDGNVYNGAGTSIGQIGGNNFFHYGLGPELIIVPVPKSCFKYFLIYNSIDLPITDNSAEYSLQYTEADVFNNIITPSKTDVTLDFDLDANSGIAVGKLRNNKSERYLYFVKNTQNGGMVIRYTINSFGISNPVTLYLSENDDFSNVEVDLSFDESMLAWSTSTHPSLSSSLNDVHVLQLDNNGDFAGIKQYQINPELQFTGVEFSPSNNQLYVGAYEPNSSVTGGGIYRIDLITQTVEGKLPNSENYGNSQLETAYESSNNYSIYAAKSEFSLGAIINPDLNSASIVENAIVSLTEMSVINKFVTSTQVPGFLLLPDQIDGEDYGTLGILPPPTITANSNTIFCSGSNVTLDAGSGYGQYSWSNGAATQTTTVTQSGIYIVTVSDIDGLCPQATAINITVNPLPIVTTSASPTTVCSSSSFVQLHATGGTTYSWQPTASLFQPNTANPIALPTANTTYTVTVTDANGCVNTGSVLVKVDNPITPFIAPTLNNQCADKIICFNGGYLQGISNNPVYYWNFGSNANPSSSNSTTGCTQFLTSGTHTVTFTVSNACGNYTATQSINISNVPIVDLGPDQITCDIPVTLDAGNPGSTYQWNTGAISQTYTVTANGTYRVTVTNSNGCTATDQVNISINKPANIISSNLSICKSETVTILVGGTGVSNYTYSWSPSIGLDNPNIQSPTASPSTTTTYIMTATSQNGCVFTDQVIVTVHPPVFVNLIASQEICEGNTFVITPSGSGSVTYFWNYTYQGQSSQTATSTSLGLHALASSDYVDVMVTVTSAFGCTNTDNIRVNFIHPPNAVANHPVSCSGSTVNLYADGGSSGLNYLWNGPGAVNIVGQSINVTPNSSPSTYTLISTYSPAGCTFTDQVTITQTQPPTVTLTNIAPNSMCAFRTVQATVNGGTSPYTYNWQGATGGTQSPVANVNVSETQTPVNLTITDAVGCIVGNSIIAPHTPFYGNFHIANDLINENEFVIRDPRNILNENYNATQFELKITKGGALFFQKTVTGVAPFPNGFAQNSIRWDGTNALGLLALSGSYSFELKLWNCNNSAVVFTGVFYLAKIQNKCIDNGLPALIDPTAVIKAGAVIGNGSVIGPYVIIEKNTIIGPNVTILSNAKIDKDVVVGGCSVIGNFSLIDKNVVLGEFNTLASNVSIKQSATTGKSVTIGANTTIDKNTKLGNSVSVGSQNQLGKDMTISDGTWIGSTNIFDKNNILGTNVVVRNSSNIGKDGLFGNGSVIGSGVTTDKNSRLGTWSEVADNLSLGKDIKICDGIIQKTSMVANQKAGTCTNPSLPTGVSSVVIDCRFAKEAAARHGNFFNGFNAVAGDNNSPAADSALIVEDNLQFFPDELANSYSWNFGDCTTSIDTFPYHTYQKPGIYVVTLILTKNSINKTYIGAVQILPTPVSTFNVTGITCGRLNFIRQATPGDFSLPSCTTSTNGCASYNSLDTTALRLKYVWNFGTPSLPDKIEYFKINSILTDKDSVITRTFPSIGNYIVTLKTVLQQLDYHTNQWIEVGYRHIYSDTISIGGFQSIDVVSDSIVCSGDSIHFASFVEGGIPPYTYSWKVDSTLFSNSVTVDYLTELEGIKSVSLIITDAGGCTDLTLKTITVEQCVPPEIPCIPVLAGTAALWKGEWNAFDEMSRNNGELTQGVTFATGKVGMAFKFDSIGGGLNQYVSFLKNYMSADTTYGAYTSPILGNFTVNFWAKTSREKNLNCAIRAAAGHIMPPNGDNSKAGVGIYFGIDGIKINAHSGGYFVTLLSWDSPVPLTDWTHVSVVFENNLPKIYSNGLLVAESLQDDGSGHIYFPSPGAGYAQPLFGIGGGLNNQFVTNSNFGNYIGLLDEIQIIDHPLTQSNIQELVDLDTEGQCLAVTLSGTIYHDVDSNCVINTHIDKPIANRLVQATPGSHYSYTDANGNYEFQLPAGTYEVKQATVANDIFNSVECLPTLQTYLVTTSNDSTIIGINFINTLKSDSIATSVSVHVAYELPYSSACSGKSQSYNAVFTNNGSLVSNPVYSLAVDPKVTILSATTTCGGTLVIDNANHAVSGTSNDLSSNTSCTVSLKVKVADACPSASPCTNNSDALLTQATLTGTCLGNPIELEANPLSETVSCTINPDDKLLVYPIGCGSTGNISGDEPLTYTIRFNNTTGAKAYNVSVMDQLDSDFDVTSVQFITSSHPVTSIEIVNPGVLKFTFTGMNLTDSSVNSLKSSGFVQFSLKLKSGLPDGTVVSNTAQIYFDSHQPITTNTTFNTIRQILDPVTLSAFNDVCVDDAEITLSGGEPTGGVYTGTGVTNGVFSPTVAGTGVHVIKYEKTVEIPEINYSLNQSGSFNPVAGSGTLVSLADDQVEGPFNVGFDFNFYGINYTSFYISSNGFIAFSPGTNHGCCSGRFMPSNIANMSNLIAFGWDDLFPPGNGYIDYFTTGTAPNRKLIINFVSIPQCCNDVPKESVQTIIYEGTNIIELHSTMVDLTTGTVGVTNIGSTIATTVPGRNASAFNITNDFVQFIPPPPPSFCTNSATRSITVNPCPVGRLANMNNSSEKIESNLNTIKDVKFTVAPNPFSGNTTLRLTLPESEWVSVTVCNHTGQSVVKLMEGQISGDKEYRFDVDGNSLSDGIYFAIVRTETKTEMRKIVLIR